MIEPFPHVLPDVDPVKALYRAARDRGLLTEWDDAPPIGLSSAVAIDPICTLPTGHEIAISHHLGGKGLSRPEVVCYDRDGLPVPVRVQWLPSRGFAFLTEIPQQ